MERIDAGAVPGRLAVVGLRKGKGSTCCADWANDWDGGGGIVAETTAASGGSVLACVSGPPAVGGLLLLDPGRPSRERLSLEGRLKLNVLVVKV